MADQKNMTAVNEFFDIISTIIIIREESVTRKRSVIRERDIRAI